MNTLPGQRMLASLPSIYRAGAAADPGGDLARLLGVFEALYFGDDAAVALVGLPGIERSVQAIPTLFAPLGSDVDPQSRTPEPFLNWLATWLAFTPHALFGADALRRIISGIVPLYGLRGTQAYLVQLIGLCFAEVRHVHVDDRPSAGLTIGSATIGSDTLLVRARPFWFKVVVEVEVEVDGAHTDRDAAADLQRKLRAVIDFAKPAHTAYELHVGPPGSVAHRRSNPDA